METCLLDIYSMRVIGFDRTLDRWEQFTNVCRPEQLVRFWEDGKKYFRWKPANNLKEFFVDSTQKFENTNSISWPLVTLIG
jgi:hypothetical protein